MENAGNIRISETQETEINANAAKLHISITGENFVYGNAALEKSVEVKNLVEDLKKLGLTDENFAVKSVSVKTETGFFAKSSKGIYQIAVHVKDLSLLSNVLGVVAGQKNANLISLEWIFDEDESRLELARQVLIKAKRKADLMAEAVGYTIVGIKNCSDSYVSPPETHNVNFGVAPPMMARARFSEAESYAPADIGTQFRGEKKISAQVTVDFIVVKTDS